MGCTNNKELDDQWPDLEGYLRKATGDSNLVLVREKWGFDMMLPRDTPLDGPPRQGRDYHKFVRVWFAFSDTDLKNAIRDYKAQNLK